MLVEVDAGWGTVADGVLVETDTGCGAAADRVAAESDAGWAAANVVDWLLDTCGMASGARSLATRYRSCPASQVFNIASAA